MTSVMERAMTEEELLIAVTDALTIFGWRWSHIRRSDRAITMGHPGLPDIIAARHGRLKFYELKTAKGQLTQDQFAWQLDMPPNSYAVEYRLVRPADLDDVIQSLR